MSDATTLEVLIQIREELAGLKKTREGLQGAKKDAFSLGEALKQGLGIGTGMQIATQAIGMLKSAIQGTVVEAFRLSGELKDTSEALGISTNALQTFRLEMKNGGVDANRLSMAIAEQTRSLAEARDAGSGAAQAYRALGLSAAAIERLPIDERILAVERATRGAADQTLAFNAASQILGSRGLPQFLASLRRVGTEGVPSVAALYEQQGLLLSADTIDRLDRSGKAWEMLWHKVVVGSGEAVSSLEAYQSAATKTVKGDLTGAGKDVRAANSTPGFGARFARNLVGGQMAGPLQPLVQLLGFLPKPAAATPAATPPATPGIGGNEASNAAAERRLALTAALKTSQAELAEILDRSATAEANEALTSEQKAAAKRKALEAEVAARRQIVELLAETQKTDFRDQAEKDAEMLKAKGDLTRAQNALTAQGNTAAQQQARQLFDLESQAISAEAAGNTKIAEQKREQIKALQLAVQLEGQAPALVEARIAAERQLTEAQRTRARSELDFSRSIGQLEQQMALVEADNALTERERQAKLLPLLAERNRLTAAHIALLEQDTRLQQGDQTSLDLQKTIDELRAQLADGQAKAASAAGPETLQMRDDKGLRDMSDPSQHYQSAEAGAAGAGKSFIAQIGTDGDIAAASISGGLNSALSDTVSWMEQLAQGAITFQEFWQGAIGYVGQMFQRMAIEMVAKMLWRSTVERALVWLGVTTHVQGEATKTAATTTGVGMRVLMGIKEALVSVYKGALFAFEALANIPYVGPFLGAAAMAAAIAGGIALVGKMGAFEAGGIVRGGRQVIQVNENGIESVLNAGATARLGENAIAMLNAGADLQDLLAADVVGGIAAPVQRMDSARARESAAPAAAPAASDEKAINLVVGIHGREKDTRSWMESQEGQKVMINQMKRAGFVHR